MPRTTVPRYFVLSVFVLLAVIAAYIFSEARRLQEELLRQTEARGAALADAMESSLRSAIVGNALLEDLIAQRLIDNARLIDQLLRFPPVDENFIKQVAQANGLRKVEILDLKGRSWGPVLPAQERKEEMMAHMRSRQQEETPGHRRGMMFMWGRRWLLPPPGGEPPSKVTERKFWQGSVFGVAVGANSFPGMIAVHADAAYILNFRKEIDVQRQIDDLGRQSDIHYAAFIDGSGKILAHTDRRMINAMPDEPSGSETTSSSKRASPPVAGADRYTMVRDIHVNGSPIGFLEIGFSLQPMDSAWRRSVHSMIVVGGAILIIGILGMATIFYLQQGHVKKITSLEAEISRQQRLSELGNMAASVAHEIRNPLNAVSMGLQRLKGEFTPTQDADDYGRFLDLMQREVRRLNSTVEQFLSLARPLDLHPAELSVGEILSELTALMQGEAHAANVEIDLQISAGLPLLEADPDYFKQVLVNLILNGIQAMPSGGTLTIAGHADKGVLELTVMDEGTGMARETAKRVFEPYFTTKANGSGLGLSIAGRIIEAHRGTIAVDSEPGRGTRFQVRLPFRLART